MSGPGGHPDSFARRRPLHSERMRSLAESCKGMSLRILGMAILPMALLQSPPQQSKKTPSAQPQVPPKRDTPGPSTQGPVLLRPTRTVGSLRDGERAGRRGNSCGQADLLLAVLGPRVRGQGTGVERPTLL